jgi:exosortase
MASIPDNISPDRTTPTIRPTTDARKFRYSSAPADAAIATITPHATVAPLPAELPSLALDWTKIIIALVIAGICGLAFYPAELGDLVARWSSDPGWSHGFVVPLISVFLVSIKWDTLRRLTPQGSWFGLAILILGVAGQVTFRATGTDHMSDLSILVLLLGAVLFVFGWQHMKILWVPIGYLACAIPMPGPLYVKLTTPMQNIAAQLGVWLLPLFGGEGRRTGTIIEVFHGSGVTQLNVEEACSGMRMLVAFFAVAVALAYSTSRPMWQKVFLAACALPIAIFCNAMRVTLTGILAARWGEQWAKGSAHAYFGLLMLIPALFMQLGIAWIFDHIFMDDHPAGATAAAGGSQ